MIKSVSLNLIATASINRKFFSECLCNGQLKTSVVDPMTKQPIFLIFDPVHDIKNLYNNFQSRKVFSCPPFGQNLLDGCHASFQHIVDLYNMEASLSLKKAHKLTPSALAPKSIEKTSVRLATSVFCESTRDSLKFYAVQEGKQSWSETADFITMVIKLWHVMNVKSRTKGKH